MKKDYECNHYRKVTGKRDGEYHSLLVSFPERLKKALKAKGVTSRDLAKEIDVTDWAVSQWMKGISLPHTDKFKLIAEALDVSADWLLGVEKKGENHDIS